MTPRWTGEILATLLRRSMSLQNNHYLDHLLSSLESPRDGGRCRAKPGSAYADAQSQHYEQRQHWREKELKSLSCPYRSERVEFVTLALQWLKHSTNSGHSSSPFHLGNSFSSSSRSPRVLNGLQMMFTLISPPSFYVFVMSAIAGFEATETPTSSTQPDPERGGRIGVCGNGNNRLHRPEPDQSY